MTSEIEALKTNEFLRRRKLRIQQVREQSKDIAKKIRQRAKVEELRQIGNLDSKKQQEYLLHQDKLVKRLEHLYTKGLQNVGASHRHASEVRLQVIPEKPDLSKARAKDAVAELRRQKQEKLDQQKQILDRKLQAREIANEISRDKSSSVANKLIAKSSTKFTNTSDKVDDANTSIDKETRNNKDDPEVVTCDMGTQWDYEGLPNEWEPHIPELSLPKDDSAKNSGSKNTDSKLEKSKRLNLFALSDEMPSSLRGGLTSVPEESIPVKTSLTLVSEYLQNRGLRLRESDATTSQKRLSDNLHSIKQTILRTRASNTEAKGNVDKSARASGPDIAVAKKNSVTIYNHSTRDTRDVMCGDKSVVIREEHADEDAYSQAMKESSSGDAKDKEHQKKLQDMRNKIAMTKQNVEKEYKDTMAFLNSLPKDKSKPIKTAYMDDQRQQTLKENRQRKMQFEFKNIQKEGRKHLHMYSHPSTSKRRSKSKSPVNIDSDEDFNARDFQYSWMPVPDSDGSLAVHTIPTTLKEGKTGNTVKFSKVDSYHEYRSRHKHTPPTKDTASNEKHVNKRVVEAVVIEEKNNDTTDCSSIASDTSSVENLRVVDDNRAKSSKDSEKKLSDAERIIIYKILEAKIDKKDKLKKKSKLIKEIAKSLSSFDKDRLQSVHEEDDSSFGKDKSMQKVKKITKNAETRVSFEQLKEGVYKTVNEKGDNITSMYFSGSPREGEKINLDADKMTSGPSCLCNKQPSRENPTKRGNNVSGLHWESCDDPPVASSDMLDAERKCQCSVTSKQSKSSSCTNIHPSAATSTSSFRTAAADEKANAVPDGFVKLIDEGGHEAGKFYIGASGFLKDDAYEMVIQLRKKDAKVEGKEKQKKGIEKSIDMVTDQCNLQPQAKVTPTGEFTKEQTFNNGECESKSPGNVSSNLLPQNLPGSSNVVIINNASQDPTDINKKQISSTESCDNLPREVISDTNVPTEKCIHTPSQTSYAIPAQNRKSDPIPRPATSIHTQTTLGSPNHRPVFMHMSSSTSTAYMSPPEFVLPKFLRHNYKINYEGMKDTTRNSVLEDDGIEVIDQEEYCEDYDGCRCRRCIHARKITLRKIKPHMTNERAKQINKKITTPPNTGRSSICDYEYDVYETPRKEKVKHVYKNNRHRNKCHKCEDRTGSKMCLKTHGTKSRRNSTTNKRPSRNLILDVNSISTVKNKKKSLRNERKSGKFNLNPIVKAYVDKLLALNKESLKAIDVVNQDCSSVTTPGSSIIEVSRNIDGKKAIANKISFEQLKDILTKQILESQEKIYKNPENTDSISTDRHIGKKSSRIFSKKKSVHKVKSLNISKHLSKPQTENSGDGKKLKSKSISSSSSTYSLAAHQTKIKSRSKSSPPRRNNYDYELNRQTTNSDIVITKKSAKIHRNINKEAKFKTDIKVPSFNNYTQKTEINNRTQPSNLTQPQRVVTTSSDSDLAAAIKHQKAQSPLDTSTQTNGNFDSDINFMKLAEDKLQNMEKIADLTEKCTKRLSNLAKVLEEVRRNKSLAYSQISDSASDSDKKSDKLVTNVGLPSSTKVVGELKKATIEKNNEEELKEKRTLDSSGYIPFLDLEDMNKSPVYSQSSGSESSSARSDKINTNSKPATPPHPPTNDVNSRNEASSLKDIKGRGTSNISDFIPFLNDIPRPDSIDSLTQTTTSKPNIHSSNNFSTENPNLKNRGKPPPALSRINLKHGQDFVIAHELSTVIEVDSPMSAKRNNQSVLDTKCQVVDSSIQTVSNKETNTNNGNKVCESNERRDNPDLLQSNISLPKLQTKLSSTDSSDDAKIQMMDLKKFNEIMLKPFISIQEYAKRCNMEHFEDGSNLEDIPREDAMNDDLSSLHSDGSLPDVIAELLKRNIISEPFKFDTVSNVNSTTVSSESTLSVLALSKIRRDKKKTSVTFQNKENIAETSDTLSISSNPDLENAFKKLGMGWASSTLKKTKERLALSSSSNTSSSSLSQYKVQNIPALVTDSVTSVLNTSNKSIQGRFAIESAKNAEQQTSVTRSMTVKEFLTNELAKKITFNNKSSRNDTEEEFVSLYETKMPEEMKHSSQIIREERSIDSGPSGSNARARTSTPVQIFKSMTYHSSSSSNLSNGLFSNADDLSSVKGTSNSLRNHSTSDKDDLTIPNYSLRMRKELSDCSKSE